MSCRRKPASRYNPAWFRPVAITSLTALLLATSGVYEALANYQYRQEIEFRQRPSYTALFGPCTNTTPSAT